MRPLSIQPGRRRVLRLPGILFLLALGPAAGCGDRAVEEEAEGAGETSTPDYESMNFAYEFDAAQKRAVGPFLETREGWRLAVASDNANPLLGRMKRDRPEYQPYFAEGDLDDDGDDDFALALTNGRGAFRVVWFRRVGSGYGPPQPLASASWLDQGGLFVDDGDLLVGEFYTDRAERYAWNPETRSLERQEVTGELRS